jgi:hypothetical protein
MQDGAQHVPAAVLPAQNRQQFLAGIVSRLD